MNATSQDIELKKALRKDPTNINEVGASLQSRNHMLFATFVTRKGILSVTALLGRNGSLSARSQLRLCLLRQMMGGACSRPSGADLLTTYLGYDIVLLFGRLLVHNDREYGLLWILARQNHL